MKTCEISVVNFSITMKINPKKKQQQKNEYKNEKNVIIIITIQFPPRVECTVNILLLFCQFCCFYFEK